MIQIRNNVFETNSSSTHSMTIVSRSKYNEWVDDDNILFYPEDNEFVTRDEAIESVRKIDADHANSTWYNPLDDYYWKNDIEDGIVYRNVDDVPNELVPMYLAHHGYYTFNMYNDDYDYEHFFQTYTSKSGDEIVAFGCYGYC